MVFDVKVPRRLTSGSLLLGDRQDGAQEQQLADEAFRFGRARPKIGLTKARGGGVMARKGVDLGRKA